MHRDRVTMAISLYKVAKFFMVASGLWKIPISEKPRIQRMYIIYSVFAQILFIAFNISMVIRLCELFGKIDLSELYTNMTLAILVLEINYKVMIYIKNGIPHMFYTVVEREETLLSSQNPSVRSVYFKQVKYYKIATFCQCFGSAFTITWFIAINLYRKYAQGVREGFMYELWFPFDKENHDIIVTAFNILIAMYGFIFNCASQTPLQTLMVSSTTYLRILQLHLRESFRSPSLSDEEKVEYIKKLIKEHQFLIDFITDLNNAVKNIILLEFALDAINGAGALLQTFSIKNAIEIPYCLMYLVLFLVNIIAIAWSANEVIVQSANVANAVYESDWMDQSKEIKTLLFIMLMRAQKPLSIDVGPFRPMNMEAALMTMKGSYSYASVMH